MGQYSMSEVVVRVNVARHRIVYAFTTGAMKDVPRLGGRRVFTDKDIRRIQKHFQKEVQI